MSIVRNIKQWVLATVLLAPCLAHAAVILPALDIVDMTGDAGATVTAGSFSIDATAYRIVFEDSSMNIDITDAAFSLSTSSGSYDPLADGGLGYGSFGGMFSISDGTDLLSGTFSLMKVFGYGDDINFDFDGDVLFTSGSLMGDFTGGRFEGAIFDGALQSKLGTVAVVPVPAAAWLFGSGLIGMIGIARRKKA